MTDRTKTEAVSIPNGWTAHLTGAIQEAVQAFASRLGDEPVIVLAVDCHPWHGSIGLSLLTAAEADADRSLVDPAEMAAWRHHDFARSLAAWQPVAPLGAEMQAAYEAGDRPAIADAFLRACADAAASPAAGAALESLPRAEKFRVSVTHPDTGREFVPLKSTSV